MKKQIEACLMPYGIPSTFVTMQAMKMVKMAFKMVFQEKKNVL